MKNVILSIFLLFAASLHAQSEEQEIVFDYEGAGFGNSIATIGDINNDGYDDLLVGAPTYSQQYRNQGAAHLYLGSENGFVTSRPWHIIGNQQGMRLGQALCAIGDVNGDGHTDIAVGAWMFSEKTSDSWEGLVNVYYGSENGFARVPDWIKMGYDENSAFGIALSGGDLNGDGYDDLVVGSCNIQSNRGAAYVYYGSKDGLQKDKVTALKGEQYYNWYGKSLDANGDINKDGYDDLLVGALNYDSDGIDQGEKLFGAAYAYYGSPKGIDTSYSWKQEGEKAQSQFGVAVAHAGDVNADGYGDVLVGAHIYQDSLRNQGAYYLFEGGKKGLSDKALVRQVGPKTNGQTGVYVQGLGDVNNDGIDDWGFHSRKFGPDYPDGVWTIRYGSKKLKNQTSQFIGSTNRGVTYHQIRMADVNGDGKKDWIIAIPDHANSLNPKGRIKVIFGQ